MSEVPNRPTVYKTRLEELEERVLLSAGPQALAASPLGDPLTGQPALLAQGTEGAQPMTSPIFAAPLAESIAPLEDVTADYVANDPIGEARGIYPGRVAWVRNADATSWDGATGRWWYDSSTNPAIVAAMLSSSIQWLAGQTNDGAAWDSIFRYHNLARTGIDVGYTPGEKITIKANFNVNSSQTYSGNLSDTSPQLLKALVAQLVDVAGVAQSDIIITDPSRYVPDKTFDYIRADYPDVVFVDKSGGRGRVQVQADTGAMVYYGDLDGSYDNYLPTVFTEADYLINVANLKRHDYAGVTLTAKNHFGSIQKQGGSWSPSHLHASVDTRPHGVPNPMGSYNPLVDINGHEQIGGKTLLYLIDGLYGGFTQSSVPSRWSTFGNDWPSSIFASQDQVAIDSVAYDFLRAEWSIYDNSDNYLHEAAQADSPPSGVTYDPENNGTPMASQGVHEHWNNAADRQYSRNLGTGDGIELVSQEPISDTISPTVTATQRNGGIDMPAALNTYAATFSEPVGDSITADDLAIHNNTTSQPVDMTGATVAWDGLTDTATWDLTALDLPAGDYTITLQAAGIHDAAGNPLDGDGDGTGGDDHNEQTMVALEGDLDLDGHVSFLEAATTVANIGLTGAGWNQGDVDCDGTVEISDAESAVANLGQLLSEAAPLATATPTTSDTTEQMTYYPPVSTTQRAIDWSWLEEDTDSDDPDDPLSMELPVNG